MNSNLVRRFVREFVTDNSKFDIEFYLSNNPDLQNAKIDPIEHFLRYGIFEGRDFSMDLSDLTSFKDPKVSNSYLFDILLNSFFNKSASGKFIYNVDAISKPFGNDENFENLVVIPNKNSYLNRLLLNIMIRVLDKKFTNITFLLSENIYGLEFLNAFETNANVLKGTNFQNINSLIDSVAEDGNFILVDLLNIKVDYDFIARVIGSRINRIITLSAFISKIFKLFKSNFDGIVDVKKVFFNYLFRNNLLLDSISINYMNNMLNYTGYTVNGISANISEVKNTLEIPAYSIIRSVNEENYFSNFILESPFVFDMGAGGGEKFFLELCIDLLKHGSVSVINTHGISRKQISWLSNFLDLDLSSITFIDLPNCEKLVFDCDFYILQNNYLLPNKKISCKYFFYHCQFPFSLSATSSPNYSYLQNCDQIIVYSQFVKNQIIVKFKDEGIQDFPLIEIIPPMVSDLYTSRLHVAPNSPVAQICSIGRFSPKGHNKNQSFFLNLLKILEPSNYFINLIGTCNFANPEDLYHYNSLLTQFYSFPVKLFPNLDRHKLIDVLNNSDIYIHLAGLGVDPYSNPEKCEHFGIAPLEAMSCSLVPFVVNNGGPAEYIVDGVNGYLFGSIDELKEKLEIFTGLSTDQKTFIKSNARNTFLEYSNKQFSINVSKKLLKLS